jgi:hypothetical protein
VVLVSLEVINEVVLALVMSDGMLPSGVVLTGLLVPSTFVAEEVA